MRATAELHYSVDSKLELLPKTGIAAVLGFGHCVTAPRTTMAVVIPDARRGVVLGGVRAVALVPKADPSRGRAVHDERVVPSAEQEGA